MKSTDAPGKQAVPFGTNGPREAITATTPPGSNQASYDQGFPPITMTLKSAGGLPPKGQDMNQILFELSSFSRYYAAGGTYSFDASFSGGISGYPSGARVPNSAKTGFWLNTSDDNTVNPENTNGSLTGWVPVGSYGYSSIFMASGGTTATSLQASKDKLILNGALTSNVNLVLPAWQKRWNVVNNCTGPYAVTVKPPSGNGIQVPTGYTAQLFCDGVNIYLDNNSQIFSGTPTAPTAPFGTNNTQIATTEFAQALAGKLIGRQIFTATGTYTPTPGTKSIIVEVQAPGGGGGGVGTTNSTSVAVASGGSAGAYAKSYLTNLSPSYSVTIGAAGAAGVPGVNGGNGGSAGNATFGGITCGGGFGGGSGNGPAPIIQNSIGVATASGGNLLNMAGAGPSVGMALGIATCVSGGGGSTPLGAGGGVHGTAGPGFAATGYGAGGGGAVAYASNSTQYAGAAGAPGLIIVWEYS